MSLEAGRGAPAADPGNQFASLQACFVEGSAEQRARERKVRRRALVISIAIQSAALALIVLIPLFGKPERLAFASYVPIPPYNPGTPPADPGPRPRPNIRPHFDPCPPCYHPTFPAHPATHDNEPPQIAPPGIGAGDGRENPMNQWGIGLNDSRPQPVRPAEERPQTPRRIFQGHIEPAMLIYRVEPAYPPLARQIRLSGSVELHAIIATDGTIRSLQVVNGHPLLVKSALDAVSQWRYRPTVLDGQPVEVDTYITVIYNLAN